MSNIEVEKLNSNESTIVLNSFITKLLEFDNQDTQSPLTKIQLLEEYKLEFIAILKTLNMGNIAGNLSLFTKLSVLYQVFIDLFADKVSLENLHLKLDRSSIEEQGYNFRRIRPDKCYDLVLLFIRNLEGSRLNPLSKVVTSMQTLSTGLKTGKSSGLDISSIELAEIINFIILKKSNEDTFSAEQRNRYDHFIRYDQKGFKRLIDYINPQANSFTTNEELESMHESMDKLDTLASRFTNQDTDLTDLEFVSIIPTLERNNFILLLEDLFSVKDLQSIIDKLKNSEIDTFSKIVLLINGITRKENFDKVYFDQVIIRDDVTNSGFSIIKPIDITKNDCFTDDELKTYPSLQTYFDEFKSLLKTAYSPSMVTQSYESFLSKVKLLFTNEVYPYGLIYVIERCGKIALENFFKKLLEDELERLQKISLDPNQNIDQGKPIIEEMEYDLAHASSMNAFDQVLLKRITGFIENQIKLFNNPPVIITQKVESIFTDIPANIGPLLVEIMNSTSFFNISNGQKQFYKTNIMPLIQLISGPSAKILDFYSHFLRKEDGLTFDDKDGAKFYIAEESFKQVLAPGDSNTYSIASNEIKRGQPNYSKSGLRNIITLLTPADGANHKSAEAFNVYLMDNYDAFSSTAYSDKEYEDKFVLYFRITCLMMVLDFFRNVLDKLNLTDGWINLVTNQFSTNHFALKSLDKIKAIENSLSSFIKILSSHNLNDLGVIETLHKSISKALSKHNNI